LLDRVVQVSSQMGPILGRRQPGDLGLGGAELSIEVDQAPVAERRQAAQQRHQPERDQQAAVGAEGEALAGHQSRQGQRPSQARQRW
jgi:hypothetical protein